MLQAIITVAAIAGTIAFVGNYASWKRSGAVMRDAHVEPDLEVTGERHYTLEELLGIADEPVELHDPAPRWQALGGRHGARRHPVRALDRQRGER